MANLTASGWTVVLIPTAGAVVTSAGQNVAVGAGGAQGIIQGKQRAVRIRLDLDNPTSGSAYPSGGIPLPTHLATTPAGDSSYGMVRNLDYLVFIGESHAASGFMEDTVWKYSPTQNSLHGYRTQYTTAGPGGPTHLPELTATWRPTDRAVAHAFYFTAYGW